MAARAPTHDQDFIAEKGVVVELQGCGVLKGWSHTRVSLCCAGASVSEDRMLYQEFPSHVSSGNKVFSSFYSSVK